MQSEAQTVQALRYEALQDKKNPSDWRVECLDVKASEVFVTIFSGPDAEGRAREYAEFKNLH